MTGEATSYTPSSHRTSLKPELSKNSAAQLDQSELSRYHPQSNHECRKDHSERNKAAGEAAQAFVNALGMAISEIIKVADKQEVRRLEWPVSLNTAIFGADKKLTASGIKNLKEPNSKWALVPICDAACA